MAGTLVVALTVLGGGYAPAAPLLPTSGATATQDSAYNVDRKLTAALRQAVEGNPGATVALIGISGQGEGRLAEFGGTKSVNPAFGAAIAGLGALTNNVSEASRPVVRNARTGEEVKGSTESVADAAMKLLSGDTQAARSLPGGEVADNAAAFASESGIALHKGGEGNSPLAIARLLAEVKNVESERSSSELLGSEGAGRFIQGLRANKGSALKGMVKDGDVAMLTGDKDGEHIECGYVFNGDTLYSVALIIPQADKDRYAASLGQVLADALVGEVKDVGDPAPGEPEEESTAPDAETEIEDEERLAPPEGNSAFE